MSEKIGAVDGDKLFRYIEELICFRNRRQGTSCETVSWNDVVRALKGYRLPIQPVSKIEAAITELRTFKGGINWDSGDLADLLAWGFGLPQKSKRPWKDEDFDPSTDPVADPEKGGGA